MQTYLIVGERVFHKQLVVVENRNRTVHSVFGSIVLFNWYNSRATWFRHGTGLLCE